MLYIANAFSGNMIMDLIPEGKGIEVRISKPTTEQVRGIIKVAPEDTVESAVGHKDTAAVMSSILGINVPFNRISLKLEAGDTLIWAQVSERLPEGATELPPGVKLTWMMAQV